MFNINQYLERFKEIIHSNEDIKRIIHEVVLEIAHINIPLEIIHVKKGVLVLKNLSPLMKTQIFFKKEEIIIALRDRTNKKVIDLQ